MVNSSRLLSTIISKKIIKPFSSTPSTQSLHKLSLVDQGISHLYMPLAFFYPKKLVDTISNGPKQISELLENSLSKTLTCYYPWAGSSIDNASLNCNDAGAEFIEVQINSSMDKIMSNQDSTIKDLTFPQGLPWKNSPDGRALTIAQLSHFDCGGIALSVCLSHKVGDACSALFFLRDWAALTRDPINAQLCPYFVKDSLMPSSQIIDGPIMDIPMLVSKDCIQKRFVISASKLRALKFLVETESGVQNPTRTEVVSALIYKCAAIATSHANNFGGGSFQHSQLVQISNLRKIISPPLPPTYIGNILTIFSTPIYKNVGDLRLPKLVADLRKSKHEHSIRDNLKENEWVSEMLDAYRIGKETFHQRNCDVYYCSSVCNMPFQYLDFGWGMPTRASIGIGPFSKFFQLMSTRDGGIEVFVNLNEQCMSTFEHNKELLKFATPVTEDNFR